MLLIITSRNDFDYSLLMPTKHKNVNIMNTYIYLNL